MHMILCNNQPTAARWLVCLHSDVTSFLRTTIWCTACICGSVSSDSGNKGTVLINDNNNNNSNVGIVRHVGMLEQPYTMSLKPYKLYDNGMSSLQKY